MRSMPSLCRGLGMAVAVASVLVVVEPACAGLSTTVDITVDTSAIAGGTAGNLYFSLNPGVGILDGLTATISNFQFTNVVYAGDEVFDGDASAVANAGTGPVPNDYVLNNTTPGNDASFDIAINTPPGGASLISFQVTLTGVAIDSPSPLADAGDDFSFQLTGPLSAGYPPLLGYPEIVHFVLPPGGNVPTVTYQANEATVVVTPPAIAGAVPEPSSVVTTSLGIFIVLAHQFLRRPLLIAKVEE